MRRFLSFRRPHAVGLVVVLAVLVVVGVLVGGVARSAPAPAKAGHAEVVSPDALIVVTSQRCAPRWTSRAAGRTVFGVDDRTARGGMIYLFDPFTGVTVAKAALRAGAVVTLTVRLVAGAYRWNCALRGRPVVTSSARTVRPVPMQGPGGPMVQIPVEPNQMAAPVAAYRQYVTGQLGLEAAELGALERDIAAGQTAAARSAWLTAHMTWHRIGGAYDAFGSLGQSIDGTAAPLQDGTASAQFTGFHKVEMDLWQTDDLPAAATDTAVLAADVGRLADRFPHESIPATELPLRTHEILEDALRDELSGEDDYGSGTDAATVEADVDGTRELLSLLAPLLDARAPRLVATVTTQLDRLDAALAATAPGGRWVAVTAMPTRQREQVDGAIGNVLETLALVPYLLQIVGSTT